MLTHVRGPAPIVYGADDLLGRRLYTRGRFVLTLRFLVAINKTVGVERGVKRRAHTGWNYRLVPIKQTGINKRTWKLHLRSYADSITLPRIISLIKFAKLGNNRDINVTCASRILAALLTVNDSWNLFDWDILRESKFSMIFLLFRGLLLTSNLWNFPLL